MPTPGELNKIEAAVAQAAAALLAREGNESLTAEELAEELAESMTETMVSAYEDIQKKSYNLVVLGHFQLSDTESYVAAVGPLSSRAVQRARGVGEHFAWDYKTRKGTGKYVLVPLIRSPNEAWDEARREGLEEYEHFLTSITRETEATYEAMRFDLPGDVRARITADWQMDPEILARVSAAACTCGLPEHPRRNSLGDEATPGCMRHPKESDDH